MSVPQSHSATHDARLGDGSRAAYDVVIVGAGFAGMYMLHRLRGLGLSARVFEQGSDVGGTWYWNRYPGARCDVESMQYSYSFDDKLQQEWDWSERYAPQPEILKYAQHVADRFNLRPDIQFNVRVESAIFDEIANTWSVATSDGKTVTAKYVVLATGCLSNARMPDFKGLKDFKGEVYHTGHWPHHPVDFTGKRVGVIGTGSSAIQSIPLIAEQAAHVTVFQRTANFSIPARNGPLTAEERQSFRQNYPEIRRKAREEMRNGIWQELPDRGALVSACAEFTQRDEAKAMPVQAFGAGSTTTTTTTTTTSSSSSGDVGAVVRVHACVVAFEQWCRHRGERLEGALATQRLDALAVDALGERYGAATAGSGIMRGTSLPPDFAEIGLECGCEAVGSGLRPR